MLNSIFAFSFSPPFFLIENDNDDGTAREREIVMHDRSTNEHFALNNLKFHAKFAFFSLFLVICFSLFVRWWRDIPFHSYRVRNSLFAPTFMRRHVSNKIICRLHHSCCKWDDDDNFFPLFYLNEWRVQLLLLCTSCAINKKRSLLKRLVFMPTKCFFAEILFLK